MEVPLVSACIGGLVSDASVYRGAEWHDAVEDGHAREKASISSRDVCVGDKGRPLLPPNKLMAPFDRGLCSKRKRAARGCPGEVTEQIHNSKRWNLGLDRKD